MTQQISHALASRWNQQLKRETLGGGLFRPIETRNAASRSRSEQCLPLSEAESLITRCLIIADGSDADIRRLLKDTGHETYFLEKNEDAIEAITSLLKKQQQDNQAAQSLHVVAHGRAGAVNLGSQEITSNSLFQKADCLSSWNISSIKLWSCETGQDTDFVNLLSKLTNADVYSSKTSINAENNDLSSHNQDNQTSLKELVPANNIRQWQGQLGLVAGTAPTTGWSDLLAADIYDPNDDHQASAVRFDLVGDANNPLLQAQQEDVTIAGNPETAYWFRARFGSDNIANTSLYVALDTTGDFAADVFIEARYTENLNNSVVSYHAVDPTKDGLTPATTAWLSHASDTSKELEGDSNHTALQVTSAGTNLDGDEAGETDTETDSWANFAFTLSDLKRFTPASSITATSAVVLYVYTSPGQQANGDIAGIDDQVPGILDQTWESLGVGISTTLDAASSDPIITGPSGSAGDGTSTKSIPENTTSVHTFTASETVTWSISSGADASKFSIASDGSLSFSSAPDYENPTDTDANNTYVVTVRATDSSGNTAEQTVTVTVTDSNDDNDPSIGDVTVSVAENIAAGTSITNLSDASGGDTDADGSALTYAITAGNDSALFAIDSSTGVITLASGKALDYETASSHSLTISATEADGSGSDTATVTINVSNIGGSFSSAQILDANYGQLIFDHTNTSLGSTQDASTNTEILFGDVITIDGQSVDALYKVKSVDANLNFNRVDFDQANIEDYYIASYLSNDDDTNQTSTVKVEISFFAADTYTGGGTGNPVTLQNVVINSYDIDLHQFQVFKGFQSYELADSTGLTVSTQSDGSVKFSDDDNQETSGTEDAGRVRVYYDAMDKFEIQMGTTTPGNVLFYLDFQAGPLWSGSTTTAETPAPYFSWSTRNLTEADANNGSFSQSATITFKNPGSTIFAGSNGNAISHSAANVPSGLTSVITRTSDTTATLTFTGNASPHESTNDLSNIEIEFTNTAFDVGSVSASAITDARITDFRLSFLDPTPDLNDPSIGDVTVSVAENIAAGTSITDLSDASGGDTDADGSALTYAITAGNDSALFAIDSSTGVISLASGKALDYETASSHSLTISATEDDGSGSDTATVTINVIDIDEEVTAGPIDINDNTDSGADDTLTNHGNPVIIFTGEPNLIISLKGPKGEEISRSSYTTTYTNGTHTVTLIDADPDQPGHQPFGNYINGNPTGNPVNLGDGTYSLKATDPSNNSRTLGTFRIQTAADADNDGVDDSFEGSNDPLTNAPYDRNGDGIPDVQQRTVATFYGGNGAPITIAARQEVQDDFFAAEGNSSLRSQTTLLFEGINGTPESRGGIDTPFSATPALIQTLEQAIQTNPNNQGLPENATLILQTSDQPSFRLIPEIIKTGSVPEDAEAAFRETTTQAFSSRIQQVDLYFDNGAWNSLFKPDGQGGYFFFGFNPDTGLGGVLADRNEDGFIDGATIYLQDNKLGDLDPNPGVILDPIGLSQAASPPTLKRTNTGDGFTVEGIDGTGLWVQFKTTTAAANWQNSLNLHSSIRTGIRSIGATSQSNNLGFVELFVTAGETITFSQHSNLANTNTTPSLRTTTSDAGYILALNDNSADNDFNDLMIEVTSSLNPIQPENIPLSSQQSSSAAAIYDFSSITPSGLAIELTVTSDCGFENQLAFVALDIDPLTGLPYGDYRIGGIGPADHAAYKAKVLNNLVQPGGQAIVATGRQTQVINWTLNPEEQGFYAPVLITPKNEVFTAGLLSAGDRQQHAKLLGQNFVGFEDLLASQRSDWDFNDVTVLATVVG